MGKLHSDAVDEPKSRVKRNSIGKKKIISVIVGIIILFFVATSAYAINEWLEYRSLIAHMEQIVEVDTFYPGTSIDGIALGGMTIEEARTKMREQAAARLNAIRFDLIYEDKIWTFEYEDIAARFDVDDKIDQAFAVAREGTLIERYNRVRQIEQNGLEFNTVLEYDIGLLSDDIAAIAGEIDLEPVDAVIEFFPDAEEKFNIIPESEGRRLDQQELSDTIFNRMQNADYGEILIQTQDVQPAIRSADLEKLTNRVVRFYTGLGTSTANRIHNVRFALGKVNGYRLEPGQVFSFNEIVGRRTEALGFRPAPIIMPDRSMQDSPGGGVCQASTMMYKAALLANLEIVERRHHSFPVFYVPPGLDAAVVYGAVDVKFKNNRETPLFFRTFYEDLKVFVEVYGEAFPNDGEIRLVSEIIETIAAPEPKRIKDVDMEHVTQPGEEKMHVQTRNGLRVRSYMEYYENGQQVSRKLIVQDFYRPIQGIIYYLPPLPPPPPAPPTTQAPPTSTDSTPGVAVEE